MRLIQVAKALNMSGQQLRRELAQVNFGVKPTDREVPDRLAHGIIRFLARKYNIELADLPALETDERDQPPPPEAKPFLQEAKPPSFAPSELPTSLFELRGTSRTGKQDGAGLPAGRQAERLSLASQSASPPDTPPPTQPAAKPRVNILRKLTLDHVAAPPRKPRSPLAAKRRTKAEREEHLQELKALARRKRRTEEQVQIKRKTGTVELPESISVKELSEKIGIQAPRVIAALMSNGIMVTINQVLDYETAAIIAADLGVQIQKSTTAASAEQLHGGNLQELLRDEPETLKPRPPIVTVMGHVDHGKTSLLDAIRKTNVAEREAGKITQRIGASEVEHEGHSITFLDTPGHEAFTAMRARGAKVTDIAILVVAADEGVMQTTVEAIDHAREAEAPMIVALTKIDLPTAQPDRVMGQLAEQKLQPKEWGGGVPVIPCSAVSLQGIEDLLHAIIETAEERQLTANPSRPAVATVIESHLSGALGPLATLIVNTGTLRTGDAFVCGTTWGKVKTLVSAQRKNLKEAPPSAGVQVSGFQSVPRVGDILQMVGSEREARRLAGAVASRREREKGASTLNLVQRISEGKVQTLKIILKADAEGSLDALRQGIAGLRIEGAITPKIIHAAIGSVTEGDVMMAAASAAVVLGFNVPLSVHVEKIADELGVKVQLYDVIYSLLDDVQALLLGLLEPEEKEQILGHLEIRGCFYAHHAEQTVGGKVLDGGIKRARFRLLRDTKVIAQGRITSLRHVDHDIKETKEGTECGLKVECEEKIQMGDTLEVFLMEFKKKVTSRPIP